MCGIAGFFRENADREEVIRRMNASIHHRGPDHADFWMDDASGLTLGHTRLAIRDLTPTGLQPMFSASGDTVIVYNGEIYNTEELSRGKQLRGTSDTEALLESIEEKGLSETLAVCRGMFALATYDRKRRTLTLARDRAGEKPLYYGFVNGSFVFGSELRVFPLFPGFQRDIDRDALAAFFRYSYVPAPRSVYRGIRKLGAGQILTLQYPFREEDLEINSFWAMTEAAIRGEAKPYRGSFEEASEELEELLRDSVRGQLVSDVPLGAYLSGGIDSSLVVSLMTELSPGSVKTFTIGFEEKRYDESEYAAAIAAHLGTEHTQLTVTEGELLNTVPKLTEIFDEPFGDSSQIPTYLVSKLAREHCTVVLSGDGADELFGGYTTYPRIGRLMERLKATPKSLRGLAAFVSGKAASFAGKRSDRLYRTALSLKSVSPEELHEAVCYHIYEGVDHLMPGYGMKRNLSPVLKDPLKAQMLLDDIHYLPDDILVKVDRAGMAVSLENRVPMLDKKVMEFSFSLPSEFLFGEDGGKQILRSILYKKVPKELLDRPKKGFSVPLKKWLLGELKGWALDLIYQSRLVKEQLVDKKAWEGLWDRLESYGQGERAVWNLLMAEAWYRKNI